MRYEQMRGSNKTLGVTKSAYFVSGSDKNESGHSFELEITRQERSKKDEVDDLKIRKIKSLLKKLLNKKGLGGYTQIIVLKVQTASLGAGGRGEVLFLHLHKAHYLCLDYVDKLARTTYQTVMLHKALAGGAGLQQQQRMSPLQGRRRFLVQYRPICTNIHCNTPRTCFLKRSLREVGNMLAKARNMLQVLSVSGRRTLRSR